MRVSLGILLVLSLGLSACGEASTDWKIEEERIVAGVDLDLLFTPPTEAERQAVQVAWAARDVSAHNVQEVARTALVLDGMAVSLRFLAHTVEGQRHIGAVLVPEGAAAASRPVVVLAHDGDLGVNLETDLWPLVERLDLARFVLVIPAFRGEALSYQNLVFSSEGEANPWEGDVEDALALLNATLAHVAAANASRIGVLGIGRGATVALLMAIRDRRIQMVVGVSGLTDFFGDFVQQRVEETLQGKYPLIPGWRAFSRQVLEPLKAKQRTLSEARLALLRRSPVYFADRLPIGQWHHGRRDTLIAASQAERLATVRPSNFAVYLYEEGAQGLATLSGSQERIRTLLELL
jgi:dienelactone hydrolase